MILIIRSMDDLPSSVAECNQLIGIRRSQKRTICRAERVVGVWVRKEIETNLPRVHSKAKATFSEKRNEIGGDNLVLNRLASNIYLKDSSSLSGVWALCSLSMPTEFNRLPFTHKINTLVDLFIKPYSIIDNKFFPVFPIDASPLVISNTMSELRQSHPSLLAKTWFLDDWDEGLI